MSRDRLGVPISESGRQPGRVDAQAVEPGRAGTGSERRGVIFREAASLRRLHRRTLRTRLAALYTVPFVVSAVVGAVTPGPVPGDQPGHTEVRHVAETPTVSETEGLRGCRYEGLGDGPGQAVTAHPGVRSGSDDKKAGLPYMGSGL
ncbi:hypothetical protein ABH927_004804 [Planotetraspora sp. GP83]